MAYLGRDLWAYLGRDLWAYLGRDLWLVLKYREEVAGWCLLSCSEAAQHKQHSSLLISWAREGIRSYANYYGRAEAIPLLKEGFRDCLSLLLNLYLPGLSECLAPIIITIWFSVALTKFGKSFSGEDDVRYPLVLTAACLVQNSSAGVDTFNSPVTSMCLTLPEALWGVAAFGSKTPVWVYVVLVPCACAKSSRGRPCPVQMPSCADHSQRVWWSSDRRAQSLCADHTCYWWPVCICMNTLLWSAVPSLPQGDF